MLHLHAGRVWQHPEALNHMVPQLCLSITTALFLIDTAYHVSASRQSSLALMLALNDA